MTKNNEISLVNYVWFLSGLGLGYVLVFLRTIVQVRALGARFLANFWVIGLRAGRRRPRIINVL